MGQAPAPAAFPVLQAGAHWRCVDLLSDLHLHPDDAVTFAAWRTYLQSTTADAVILLGDVLLRLAQRAYAKAQGLQPQSRLQLKISQLEALTRAR